MMTSPIRSEAKKQVFVVGEEAFNFRHLRQVRDSENYDFRGLFTFDEVQRDGEYPLQELHRNAKQRLDGARGEVAGILGYWDFPVTSLVALLCDEHGLRFASKEAVAKCEHKYWGRLLQREVVPECVPEFRAVDPFDDSALARLDLPYPYWLKPIKSHSSQLGFRINDADDLRRAVAVIRRGIGRFAEPFNYFMDHVDLSEEVTRVDGHYCIAEQIIGGRQCTVEGYVYEGRPETYAIIDSIRHEKRSSFARYQYPSKLPAAVQARLADSAKKVMLHLGFDNATFNIEFFWDEVTDKLWLLEINPRLSQSHSAITEMVDGTPNLEKMVEIAVGKEPRHVERQGQFACAAKFFIRKFQDAIVTRVPSQSEIRRLQDRIPGIDVQIVPEAGRRLSQLQNQDSYSFELATLHIGAMSDDELVAKYRRCADELKFQFSHRMPSGKVRIESRSVVT